MDTEVYLVLDEDGIVGFRTRDEIESMTDIRVFKEVPVKDGILADEGR